MDRADEGLPRLPVTSAARVWQVLVGPWEVLWARRVLIYHLLRQEIRITYARTVLGLYWIALLPVFYVLVFVGVRLVALNRGGGQWVPDQTAPETTLWAAFAIAMGLLVFWLASEVLNRSPGAVRRHAVLVTDLSFPVEVLPWVTVGLSLFNFVVRFLLFVGSFWLLLGPPPWQIFLLPLAVLPLLVVMIGVAYCFAAVGVFLSDLEFVIQILMTALLLLSGVLFPLTIVPEPYRTWLYLNPIAYTIREARKLGLDGQDANWFWLGGILLGGLIFSAIAYWAYQRLRPRFSDML